MEQQLKQRLVGAVALVSLAVIFLPMVFDGSGYKGGIDMIVETPARPEITFDQYFKNMPESGAEGVRRMHEQIDVRDLTRQSFRESALKESWIIQAGVFSQLDNAKLQIDKLQKIGYAADYRQSGKSFVVEIKQPSKEAADKIVAELKASGIADVFVRNQ